MKRQYKQRDSIFLLPLRGFCLLLFVQSVGHGCTHNPHTQKPKNLVLNLTESPHSSQAVSWRTTAPVKNPQIQYALATSDSKYKTQRQTLPAKTEAIEHGFFHSAILTGLSPDTRYVYRVGSDAVWGEWNSFQTASSSAERFRFIYLGDLQDRILSTCSRVIRAAYARAPDARMMLLAGDLVTTGHNSEQWDDLFEASGWIPRVLPWLPTAGNHEYCRKHTCRPKLLTPIWRAQFNLPLNGPQELEETVYFLDYQGVRFVVLNGTTALEEQAQWLKNVLQKSPQHWTIVLIHQPVYSTAKKRDNKKLRTLFVPIFDQYAVDLVLQGHDHSYGRTHKLKGGKQVDETDSGTVYVVSVAGPKVYSLGSKFSELFAKSTTGNQLYQVIDVSEEQLLFESWTANGELFDSFTLAKTKEQD